jgi:hypothetical protein
MKCKEHLSKSNNAPFFLAKIPIHISFFVDIIHRFFLYVLLYLKRYVKIKCTDCALYLGGKQNESEPVVLLQNAGRTGALYKSSGKTEYLSAHAEPFYLCNGKGTGRKPV